MSSSRVRRTLRMSEVADDLGISERTVNRWVAKGLLPHYRIEGVVLIAPDALQQFLESHLEGVKPPSRLRLASQR